MGNMTFNFQYLDCFFLSKGDPGHQEVTKVGFQNSFPF